jgi:ABC-type transport system involved in cytochrome bd biosynthesis fused ATPase/permease subunit
MQYGALGVILFTFVVLVWRGVPAVAQAFRNFLDNLIATFKAEIHAERELGIQNVKDEREANTKNNERLVAAIEKNTQTVESLRTQVLGKNG